MNLLCVKRISLVMLFLLGSSYTHANLVVDESIVIYDHPSKTKHDIAVYNTDEQANLFLEVTPYEVIAPGQPEQQLEPLNLDTSPKFLVSPNRAIVAPNTPMMVRLLNLENTGNQERVYRINLIPATPPPELEEYGEEGVTSMLQVVVAYQILVIILPENPTVNVLTSRQGNTVTFSNTGNANYLLADGVQCSPMEPSDCLSLESRRVYPGNTWSIELPFDGPANYTIRSHEGSSDIAI